MSVPRLVRTPRMVLRPWRGDDAELLLPVLEANQTHLGPWIPRRVAEPVPIAELAERLSQFGVDFEEEREWRYGLFTPDQATVLGEVGLYPRNAEGRVAFAGADRVEVGYWLRADMTGRGLATEAARAVLDVAAFLGVFGHVEIRCDARNAPSIAVPRRLGFAHTATIEQEGVVPGEAPIALQVWTRAAGEGSAGG